MTTISETNMFFNHNDGSAKLLRTDSLIMATDLSTQNGFTEYRNVTEALSGLEQGVKVMLKLTNARDNEIYNLVKQFGGRFGHIQHIDSQNNQISEHVFDKGKVQLLIIATDDVIQQFSANFPIMQHFGMTYIYKSN